MNAEGYDGDSDWEEGDDNYDGESETDLQQDTAACREWKIFCEEVRHSRTIFATGGHLAWWDVVSTSEIDEREKEERRQNLEGAFIGGNGWGERCGSARTRSFSADTPDLNAVGDALAAVVVVPGDYWDDILVDMQVHLDHLERSWQRRLAWDRLMDQGSSRRGLSLDWNSEDGHMSSQVEWDMELARRRAEMEAGNALRESLVGRYRPGRVVAEPHISVLADAVGALLDQWSTARSRRAGALHRMDWARHEFHNSLVGDLTAQIAARRARHRARYGDEPTPGTTSAAGRPHGTSRRARRRARAQAVHSPAAAQEPQRGGGPAPAAPPLSATAVDTPLDADQARLAEEAECVAEAEHQAALVALRVSSAQRWQRAATLAAEKEEALRQEYAARESVRRPSLPRPCGSPSPGVSASPPLAGGSPLPGQAGLSLQDLLRLKEATEADLHTALVFP